MEFNEQTANSKNMQNGLYQIMITIVGGGATILFIHFLLSPFIAGIVMRKKQSIGFEKHEEQGVFTSFKVASNKLIRLGELKILTKEKKQETVGGSVKDTKFSEELSRNVKD